MQNIQDVARELSFELSEIFPLANAPRLNSRVNENGELLVPIVQVR